MWDFFGSTSSKLLFQLEDEKGRAALSRVLRGQETADFLRLSKPLGFVGAFLVGSFECYGLKTGPAGDSKIKLSSLFGKWAWGCQSTYAGFWASCFWMHCLFSLLTLSVLPQYAPSGREYGARSACILFFVEASFVCLYSVLSVFQKF